MMFPVGQDPAHFHAATLILITYQDFIQVSRASSVTSDLGSSKHTALRRARALYYYPAITLPAALMVAPKHEEKALHVILAPFLQDRVISHPFVLSSRERLCSVVPFSSKCRMRHDRRRS